MLVLTRKSRESVAVGDSERFERLLKVTVLEIKGGSVKLGFDVADDIPVHRWEVWERIRAAAHATSRSAERHDIQPAHGTTKVLRRC